MKFFILEQDECDQLLSTRTQKTYSKYIEGTKIDVAFIDNEIYFKLNKLLTFSEAATASRNYYIHRALRDTFANVFKIGRDYFVQAKYLYTYVNYFVGKSYCVEQEQNGLVKALLNNPSLFELNIEYSDFNKRIVQDSIKYISPLFKEADENTKGFSFCFKKIKKEYYNNYKNEASKKKHRWYENNKEHVKEYRRAYYLKKKAAAAAKALTETNTGIVANNINAPVNVVKVKNNSGTITVPQNDDLLHTTGGTISVNNSNVIIGDNNVVINTDTDQIPTFSDKTDLTKLSQEEKTSLFEKIKKFFKGTK